MKIEKIKKTSWEKFINENNLGSFYKLSKEIQFTSEGTPMEFLKLTVHFTPSTLATYYFNDHGLTNFSIGNQKAVKENNEYLLLSKQPGLAKISLNFVSMACEELDQTYRNFEKSYRKAQYTTQLNNERMLKNKIEKLELRGFPTPENPVDGATLEVLKDKITESRATLADINAYVKYIKNVQSILNESQSSK